MKFITAFIFTTLLMPPSVNWSTDFDTAKTEAATSKKFILLNFSGSDWCIPCIKMKKDIFESSAFQNFATDKLVLVKADFPRLKKNQLPKQQVQQNEALAAKYNPQGVFPFTILLDAQGKVLKTWNGLYKGTPESFTQDIQKLTATHGGK
ncbi:MAG: thioredoxin family protein [Saprospiraceae bacterium]|nr:thioredoxin family protein [Saprospiraceae bacterium]